MTQHQRIEQALAQIDGWIGPNGVPGAGAAVLHNSELIAERYAGEAAPGTPVDERTIFALASVTKPVTAAVMLHLAERGQLSLDEPVSAFAPEFLEDFDGQERAIRETVTVRHLLCHTSGLPEDLPRRTFRESRAPSLRDITDAFFRLPLLFPPGSELRYSNAGYGVAGRLVEHVAARSFWDVATEAILEPLALHDTVARPGPALDPRIARVADPPGEGLPTESYNSPYWRDLGIPWGGLYGTPRDLSRFAAAFLSGGPRLLAPATVREMTTDQVMGKPGEVQSARVAWPVAWWGLGWEVKGSKRKHWTGELTSPDTFCHFGAAGTLLWADPRRSLAVAVFANRATIPLWPFVPARWARLSNSLIAALSP